MAQLSLAELKAGAPAASRPQEIGFTSIEGFQALQRMANLFCSSSMVPDTFRGPNNLGNAVIALDMAIRMKANPLAIMQNIYLVHGRPAWSAQFLIATLNKSGKFTSLRYEFEGEQGKDDWGCRACATEISTGEVLRGPLITIGLARKEGWMGKNGSKWQSMPELMLRYRAASWFVRAYAPEIAMGLPEADELHDTIDVSPIPQTPSMEEASEISVEAVKEKTRRRRASKSETVQPAPIAEEDHAEPVEEYVEAEVVEEAPETPQDVLDRWKAEAAAEAD